jgi:hypothetical protein
MQATHATNSDAVLLDDTAETGDTRSPSNTAMLERLY